MAGHNGSIRLISVPLADHDYAEARSREMYVRVRVVYETPNHPGSSTHTEVAPSWSGINGEVVVVTSDLPNLESAPSQTALWNESLPGPSYRVQAAPETEDGGNPSGTDSDDELDASPPVLQAERSGRRMEVCRICQCLVLSSAKLMHIRRAHLKREFFRCRHCTYFSTYSCGNVRLHMRSIHGSKLTPLQPKNRNKDLLTEMSYMCFSDQRLLRWFEEEVVETVADLVEWAAEGVHPEDLMPVNQARHATFGQPPVPNDWETRGDDLPFDVLDVDDDPIEPVVDAVGIDDPSAPISIIDDKSPLPNFVPEPVPKLTQPSRTTMNCRLCGMRDITHLERHVLQHHFDRLIFLCPHCDYGSKYALNAVKDHIRAKHNRNGSRSSPINMRYLYAVEIGCLYTACFGKSNSVVSGNINVS